MTCSARHFLIVSYLIGHLVISAIQCISILYYRMEIYINDPLTKQATDKISLSRKSACQRASLDIFFAIISTKTPDLSFNVWVGTYEYDTFLGFFVAPVHSMRFPFYIILMTWDYKQLTRYRQNTHIEIIYSMRARTIYAFLHFKPAI